MVLEEIVRVDDEAHLWVCGRQVCPALQRMVETLFSSRRLKDFTIYVDRGMYIMDFASLTLTTCRFSGVRILVSPTNGL